MKRWLLPVFFILASMTVAAESTEADRRWVLETLRRYSPDGYDIVVSFQEEFPEEGDFMDWYEGETEQAKWHSLVTIVHELTHGYIQGFAKPGSLFFPTGLREGVDVPLTKVYRTRSMASTFPEALRTFSFWYVDNEDENLGAQAWGAYGLLDEMAAYYQGAKFPFEALAAFRSNPETADWKTWFEVMNSTMAGAAEFRLFILKYLQYAEKRYPDVAKGIYGNAAFREAFQKLDQRMVKFYSAAIAVEPTLYGEMSAAGYTFEILDETCKISKFRKSSFVGLHFNTYELVRAEMAGKAYQGILAKLHDGVPPVYPVAATASVVATVNARAAANAPKLSPPGSANGKILWQPNLAAAVARAEKDYRLILVQVGTPDSLKSSGKALRSAFEDPTVIASLAPYVCLKVNLDDSGDGAYFRANYERPNDLPAIFFLDCTKRLISSEILADWAYGPELASHQLKTQLAFYGDRNGLVLEHMIRTDVKWERNIDEAIAKARRTSRNLLVYFYMNSAQAVISLNRETFGDPEIAAFMNTTYVNVKIEVPPADTDQTALDMMDTFEVWAVPRIILMDSRMNVLRDKASNCGYEDMVSFLH